MPLHRSSKFGGPDFPSAHTFLVDIAGMETFFQRPELGGHVGEDVPVEVGAVKRTLAPSRSWTVSAARPIDYRESDRASSNRPIGLPKRIQHCYGARPFTMAAKVACTA